VKPPPLRYERPDTVEEAVSLLSEHGDEAKILAGGQSLVPLLNMRLARPAVLVDINRVVSLDYSARSNGTLRVGALVRQADKRLGEAPLLAACLPHVGHVVTRNRGTVAGSLAHADAAAELPLALVALRGSVVAVSPRGEREIPADDLFLTHFTTALAADELVSESRWPVATGRDTGFGFAFEELAQRAGDYALAMVACVLRIDGTRVSDARIAVGAVVDRPTVLSEASALLVGSAVEDALAEQAARLAAASVDPYGGLHASADYLRHVTGVLVERAVLAAWRDARDRGR
jgi:carbon-monoxide dehydrogenase medium subunit